MDSVLVTGGGFIGSHVATHYDERGVEVTALDNLSHLERSKPPTISAAEYD